MTDSPRTARQCWIEIGFMFRDRDLSLARPLPPGKIGSDHSGDWQKDPCSLGENHCPDCEQCGYGMVWHCPTDRQAKVWRRGFSMFSVPI